MAEPKTRPTTASVEAFLAKVADEGRREDCRALAKLMKQVTRQDPVMWGPSIVGFGSYRYVYASGKTAEWPLVGFSPRKQDLTIYVMGDFARREALLAKLGKHKASKACVYVKRLADVDAGVLKELVAESVRHLKAKHPLGEVTARRPSR